MPAKSSRSAAGQQRAKTGRLPVKAPILGPASREFNIDERSKDQALRLD